MEWIQIIKLFLDKFSDNATIGEAKTWLDVEENAKRLKQEAADKAKAESAEED